MLNWSSIIDCPGQLVVISDALDSPGEYILHDLVSSNAKTKDTFCILVSLNETFDHWKTIALRRVSSTQNEYALSTIDSVIIEPTNQSDERRHRWKARLHQWRVGG